MKTAAAPSRRVVIFLHALLAAALVATIVEHLVTLPRPLSYPHAWGAAGAMIEARAFRNEGIVHLRVVPIANNSPFGLHPEAYVHWPPGIAVVLTWWTRAFGESESSLHAYTLTLYLLETGVLYWLIRLLEGAPGAAIGTLAWLTLPVSVKYAHVILNETLGMPFILISAAAVLLAVERPESRRVWRAIGAGATVLAVFATWEAVFVPIGLIAASYWSRGREERRIGWWCLYFALGTVAAILIWYAVWYPSLFLDTLHTLTYRMGLSASYSTNVLHNDPSISQHLSLLERIRMESGSLVRMIGGVGLAALAIAGSTEAENWRERVWRGPRVTIFLGLILSAGSWFVLFTNHSAIHEFEFILLAPAATIAVAWCVIELLRMLDAGSVRRFLLVTAAPLLMMMPLMRHVHGSVQVARSGGLVPMLVPRPEIMEPDEFVEFGRFIRAQTTEGSVVVSPEPHMVPPYYSFRHTIGGVKTESDLNKILPEIEREFPGSPVYLALFTKDSEQFSGVLAAHPPNDPSGPSIVVRLK